MNYFTFIRTLPEVVVPRLPTTLQQSVKPHQPFRWVIQFNFGEPRLHYEVGRVARRLHAEGERAAGLRDLELGFHCEAKDKSLNRYLLYGFRRHLFEIKDTLGTNFEAEMWDKGWTKIYERYPEETISPEYQAAVGLRLAEIITCLHPIFVDLRRDVMRMHR